MSSDTPLPSPETRTFRRVLLFFVLILVVLLGVVAATLRNLSRSIATADWVNHTHALINELDSLQPNLAVAENDLENYLRTGDARAQTGYQEKFAEIAESVDVLNALVAQTPDEKQQFAPIAALLARRAEHANEAVRLKKAGDPKALPQWQAADAGEADRRELARLLEKFHDKQTTLLTERDRAQFLQAQTTRWTVVVGAVLDFLLLCGAAWLIRDDLAARRRAADLLARTNEELEEKVRQRTVELSTANAALVTRNIEDRWAKQALEHQNRYNLLIIDSISDAVFVVTRPMNVSRVNPATVHLTGYQPSELVDQPLAHVVKLNAATHHVAHTTFDLLHRTLIDGHELRDQPAVVAASNGQMKPVRLNLYPLRDRDKVVGGVIILQALAPAK